MAGAALALLGLRSDVGETTGRFLAQGGGVAIAAGILMQGAFADLVYDAQPQSVMASVMRNPWYGGSAWGWVVTGVLLFVVGLLGVIASSDKTARKTIAIGAALIAFLNVGAVVMVRDGIRDFTLRAQGFEVWDRVVVTNWSVVAIFLVLFVAALGVIGYLMRRKSPPTSLLRLSDRMENPVARNQYLV